MMIWRLLVLMLITLIVSLDNGYATKCQVDTECGLNAYCDVLKTITELSRHQVGNLENKCQNSSQCFTFAECIEQECRCRSGYEMKGKKCEKTISIALYLVSLVIVAFGGLVIGVWLCRRYHAIQQALSII